MKPSVMFSVIIPVYNAARYLRAFLDSVRGQTFLDWEAICVDDGSSDGSAAVLDEYAAMDNRFKVIHQSNGGEGAARNAGLERAGGEWICFADSDDVLHCGLLEVYNRLIGEHSGADVVSVASTTFKVGAEPHWPSGAEWRAQTVDVRRAVPISVFQVGIWALAFRREHLDGLRFEPLKVGADRVFVCQLVECARKVILSDFVGYGYRLRADSMYHARHTSERFLDHLRHYLQMVDCICRSDKVYDDAIYRKIGLEVSEYLSFDYRCLSAVDRRRVWVEWISSLRALAEVARMPFSVRIVARIVGGLESRAVMWILCYGVGWLKLHGVNRRLAVHRLEDFGE